VAGIPCRAVFYKLQGDGWLIPTTAKKSEIFLTMFSTVWHATERSSFTTLNFQIRTINFLLKYILFTFLREHLEWEVIKQVNIQG
jgi:hypothetical protein